MVRPDKSKLSDVIYKIGDQVIGIGQSIDASKISPGNINDVSLGESSISNINIQPVKVDASKPISQHLLDCITYTGNINFNSTIFPGESKTLNKFIVKNSKGHYACEDKTFSPYKHYAKTFDSVMEALSFSDYFENEDITVDTI